MKLSRFLQYFARVQPKDDPTIKFKTSVGECELVTITFDVGKNEWTATLKEPHRSQFD